MLSLLSVLAHNFWLVAILDKSRTDWHNNQVHKNTNMHIKNQKTFFHLPFRWHLPSIKPNRHPNKRFAGLLHLSPSAKRFMREYSLPLVVTLIFLFALLGTWMLRASERSALIELLPSISEINHDYSQLLSGDKADQYTKNQDNADTPQPATTASAPTPSGTPSSLAINTSVAPSTTTPTTGGGSTAQPFASSIASFQQSSVALECTGNIVNKGLCSKRYTFSAVVRTSNGPGTVNYSWRSSYSSANQDASYSAGSGTATNSLQKQILLACNSPATYTVQMLLTSPTPTQSAVLTLNHNCNDI